VLDTAVVVTVKVAVVAPAGIVTEAGTVAAEFAELSGTVRPPVGAAALIVTVPVELLPPATEVGLRLSAVTIGALTVRVVAFVLPLSLAWSVTEVFVATGVVVTVKVALVAPAATVTEAGTVAAALPEVSATTWPPAGAGDARATVPVELVPPVTVDGLTVMVTWLAAFTVKLAEVEAPLRVAVMLPVWLVETVFVVTVKVALVAPAATVTVAGTVAAVRPEVRLTESPPVGAAPVRVTVPVELVPPVTEVGFKLTVESTGALTVRVAVAETLFAVAVIVAVWFDPTATVVAVNVADVLPAATVTEAGTVTAELLEVSVTAKPPVGAGPFRVTVPVELVPPDTVVGFIETLDATVASTVRVPVT